MRVTIIATAVLLSAIGISAATDAEAAIKKPTNIPAQELGAALQILAKEHDFQVVYRSEVVGELRTQGAVGEFTAQEALTQLLHGTGLTYRYLDERTVTVSPPTALLPLSAHRGSVSEATKEESPGWFSRLRLALAQNDQTSRTDSSSSGQQKTSENSSETSKEPRHLEEVIVTAQKREERLIDVPQSVSVLSSDALAKLGATQFRDFANAVPGLNITTTGAGLTQVSLRGVTVGVDIGPTVGIYVDEVPYGPSSGGWSAQQALDMGLFDLERIEVLRGPQGTLYGASSMGGLLKYVTRQPDSESFGVDAQTGVSNTHGGGVSYNAAITVNAPIAADKAALRASGFYSHDGGYIDNLARGETNVNRSHIYGGRADLLLTPTEALTIRITGFVQDIARDGEGTANYASSGVPLDGSLDQRRMVPEPFDQRFRLVSGTVTYDLGPAILTSISSYQTVQSPFVADITPLLAPILPLIGLSSISAVGITIDRATDKFTQEVRFASEDAQTLEWVIGGFYTRETSDLRSEFIMFDLAGQPAPNALGGNTIPSRYEEYAAFGDLTWHLTDKFDVTSGIRYARNDQKLTQFTLGGVVSRPTAGSTEDVFTYLANARYRFSDHATAYLRYATGYRPGGANLLSRDPVTGLPLGEPTFESDGLKSYEIGLKAETADRRFGLDVAGYYVDWSNIQVGTSRGVITFLTNAPGGATVWGAELAVTARPTDAFTVTGALAYTDAELSEADPDLGAAKGDRLPNVPRFSAALNADYDLQWWGSLRPVVGATLRYVDDRMASFDNSRGVLQQRLPDYATVDLRAGLTLGPVNAQLYVRNLFDERGQLSAFNWRRVAMPAILQPRTIGISVTTHF